MANPLFSTYRQGENRVTSTILAVFERLSFGLVERLLQALCQEPETSLLAFVNQPQGIDSRPDALIRASFAYWIETKIVVNAVSQTQLARHLEALHADCDIKRQRLLVLTPDEHQPDAVTNLHDSRLAWANFDDLVRAIHDVTGTAAEWLTSNRPQVSAQERALLRELVQFLMLEGLVGRAQAQAVIVAARLALAEYRHHLVYMCQPRRTFQACSHIGFYAEGQIYPSIPAILGSVDAVVFTAEAIAARDDLTSEMRTRLLHLLDGLKHTNSDRLGEEQKVLFLSAPDAPETLRLTHGIVNDLTSDTGRAIAFVQGQRYVPLARLKANPRTTTELLHSND